MPLVDVAKEPLDNRFDWRCFPFSCKLFLDGSDHMTLFESAPPLLRTAVSWMFSKGHLFGLLELINDGFDWIWVVSCGIYLTHFVFSLLQSFLQ
jgi:hypothetical protein